MMNVRVMMKKMIFLEILRCNLMKWSKTTMFLKRNFQKLCILFSKSTNNAYNEFLPFKWNINHSNQWLILPCKKLLINWRAQRIRFSSKHCSSKMIHTNICKTIPAKNALVKEKVWLRKRNNAMICTKEYYVCLPMSSQ